MFETTLRIPKLFQKLIAVVKMENRDAVLTQEVDEVLFAHARNLRAIAQGDTARGVILKGGAASHEGNRVAAAHLLSYKTSFGMSNATVHIAPPPTAMSFQA